MEKLERCPITDSPLSPALTCKDHTVTGDDFTVMANAEGTVLTTNPRPESDELGKYYESDEYISHTDSNKGVLDRVYQVVRNYSLRKKRALLKQHLSKGSILDIGCGTGDFLLEMKSNSWAVSGMEPNDEARKKAESKIGTKLHTNPALTDLPSGSFDAITMWHVLEHVPDPTVTTNRIFELLKPGGVAVIAVPNFKSKDAHIYGSLWAAYDVPRHLFHFSQAGMIGLFTGRGFNHVKNHPMVFDSYYVSLLSEKYKSGRRRWIPAFVNGLRSNLSARNSGEWSSIIYIFQKPK